MEDKTILSLFAMGMLTILEVCAMLNGIDGYLFGMVVAAISAISGYEIKSLINKTKETTNQPTQ